MTLNADGTLTFAPTANFNGTAAFTYGVGTGLHYQLFDASFDTVANIPVTGGFDGFATDFNVPHWRRASPAAPTPSASATPVRSTS